MQLLDQPVRDRKTWIPPLTRREVLSLAAMETGPYRVLSLYLDTDSQAPEPAVIRTRAHSLLHQAEQELEEQWSKLDHDIREAAREDLARCRAFIDTFRARGACRGLALFSCSGRNAWQHYPLPRPVPDRVAWGEQPLVLPAVRLLEEYPRTGVILVDREQGRFLGSRLGEVEELGSMREDTPQRVKEAGWYGLEERRIERHIEDHVRRHLKHVAAEARDVFQDWPVAGLLVGGNTELTEEFRRCLPPSLRDRWARELALPANASLEQVHEAVLAAEQELEQEREEALLRQLYGEWDTSGYGIVGVTDTLRALYLGEVDRLVVDADLRLTGYRCEKCGALAETADRCHICGWVSFSACADLVGEAIEEALAHGGQVQVVGSGASSTRVTGFRRDGGLGALLRFRPR
jgi:peptide chain release factor subunit 1